MPEDRPDFEAFMAMAEPRLRRALVAAYGPDVGRDAAVEALAWAWVHWERVQAMDRPLGYLFRVAQSASRHWRWRRPPPAGKPGDGGSTTHDPWVEPGLRRALDGLSHQQRVAVVLCHGFEWTHREVADLLGIAPSSVQNHVERGLTKLRRDLEVNHEPGRSTPA